mgnify:CR=1 FL=1
MPRIKGSRKGKIRYPKFYHIRVEEETLKRLKKIGSKKIREILENL